MLNAFFILHYALSVVHSAFGFSKIDFPIVRDYSCFSVFNNTKALSIPLSHINYPL